MREDLSSDVTSQASKPTSVPDGGLSDFISELRSERDVLYIENRRLREENSALRVALQDERVSKRRILRRALDLKRSLSGL